MKKFLVFLLGLTIAMTSMTFSVIPASAEDLEILDENVLFIETFEEYATGKNWIETKAKNNVYNTVSNTTLGVEKAANSWVYSTYNASIVGGSVTPVTLEGAAHAGRGQVLEVVSPTSSSGYINLIRTANGTTGIVRKDQPEGKKLVVEVKFYVPKGEILKEGGFLSNPRALAPKGHSTFDGLYSVLISTASDTNCYFGGFGRYGYPQARNKSGELYDEWHTLRTIYDTSKEPSVAHSDTTRALLDDYNVFTAYHGAPASATGYMADEVPATPASKWYIKDHPTYPWYTKNEPGAVKQIDYLNTTDSTNDDDCIIKSKDFVYSVDVFRGTQFSAANNSSGTAGKYYIDDLKAYYIDALDFEVKNASDYSGGEVKLTFNQSLKEEFKETISNIPSTSNEKSGTVHKLASLFTMIDKDGNVVDGGIEAFALSEDKKVVSITPATTLTKGEDYQIVIDPLLIDVYGQGLNKNGHNNATYVDLHISKEFVPFAVESQSHEVFEGFMQGRNAEITVDFTKAILNDAAITEGIVVTKEDGTVIARNEGWTAELSANKKTITFDFTNLPTADYIITANDKLTDENEAPLEGEFEIKLEKADDMIVFFNETFDDDKYTVDKNWINAETKVERNYSTITEFDVNDGDWTIQRHWNDGVPATETFVATDDFVGVVAVPENANNKMSGNVLKVYNSRGTSVSKNYVAFRRNFNKDKGINLCAEEYEGKKLVFEADVYIVNIGGTTPFLLPSPNKTTVRDFNDWKSFFTNDGKYTGAGAYQNTFSTYGPMAMFSQAVGSEKAKTSAVNYKVVVSKTENVDTVALYENGKLIQRPESKQAVLKGHPYNDSARHEFVPSDYTDANPIGSVLKVNDVMYGIWSLASRESTSKNPVEVYVDNFKAYMVDEFKVVDVTGNSDVFNAKTGTVNYTFTKPVALSSTTDGVVLVDENGDVVENGIKSVNLTDAGYKMAVSLNDKVVSGLTNYSVKLTEGLRDVDGLTLSTAWEYKTYPIDQYYSKNGTIDVTTNKVTTTYDAYSITDIANTATLDCAYIPATDKTPAHLVYKNSSGSFIRVAADLWVRDADAMKMYAPLTTTKSTSVYAIADEAVVSGNNVTTKVTITNPEAETKSIWCIVAAYGKYDQMLGHQLIDCKELAGNTQVKDALVSFTADTTKGEIAYVRMFLWNSKEDMVSYQRAEDIPSK